MYVCCLCMHAFLHLFCCYTPRQRCMRVWELTLVHVHMIHAGICTKARQSMPYCLHDCKCSSRSFTEPFAWALLALPGGFLGFHGRLGAGPRAQHAQRVFMTGFCCIWNPASLPLMHDYCGSAARFWTSRASRCRRNDLTTLILAAHQQNVLSHSHERTRVFKHSFHTFAPSQPRRASLFITEACQPVRAASLPSGLEIGRLGRLASTLDVCRWRRTHTPKPNHTTDAVTPYRRRMPVASCIKVAQHWNVGWEKTGHVCIYVYVYVHIYIYMYTHRYTSMHPYIWHTYIHTHIYM